jgi:hypothetical protein
MLCREIMAICYEIHTKHTNTLCGQSVEFLMLYREIMSICSEIHTKHINTLCGQNVELLNIKHGGIAQPV